MDILILGCGSSVGSPIIGKKITSFDSKDFRTRSSILVNVDNKKILIDSGADFRYQALKNNIDSIINILIFCMCLFLYCHICIGIVS